MKTFTEQELKEILRKHKLWIEDSDQQDAERANLYGANLGFSDLSGADLRGADLGDWERDPDTGLARRKSG